MLLLMWYDYKFTLLQLELNDKQEYPENYFENLF